MVHVAEAAVGAFDLAGEAAGVQALVGKGTELAASGHLVLHKLEGLHVDDRLVGVLHKVLRKLALVLPALLRDGIFDVLLLQKQVPGVGDVGEDYLDVGITPFASGLCGDAFAVQLALRFQTRLAVKEVLEDALHNGRFLRNHHKVVVLPFVTEDLVPEVRYAFFKALPDAPFHIVAEAGDFLLREGGQQRQHNLAVA